MMLGDKHSLLLRVGQTLRILPRVLNAIPSKCPASDLQLHWSSTYLESLGWTSCYKPILIRSNLKLLLVAEVSKPELAKTANLVRKEILVKVKSGVLICNNARWEISSLDSEKFQDAIIKTFRCSLQHSNISLTL